jgi:hypothetical protein
MTQAKHAIITFKKDMSNRSCKICKSNNKTKNNIPCSWYFYQDCFICHKCYTMRKAEIKYLLSHNEVLYMLKQICVAI